MVKEGGGRKEEGRSLLCSHKVNVAFDKAMIELDPANAPALWRWMGELDGELLCFS